jgi:hypothetical protein
VLGLQVNDHKRPFLWLLDQLPFFIKADRVKDCVFHIPEDAKIKADRVEENVPIFKDKVSISYALPGAASEAAPVPHVDHSDELAAAQAEPVGQEVIEGLPAPEPEEDEISISNREKLKAEATSLNHLVSHFPKNPFCETCKIAKMTSARIDHKAKKDDESGLPIPEGFGHIIVADTVILASEVNQGAKGAAGEKDALFIKDAYSGARMIITQTNHTKENNISGLQ